MSAFGIASRIAAAAIGGYALAAAVAASAATALPGPGSEAVLIGIMLGFVVYTGAMLWAFAARTPIRAWAGLLIPTLAFALIAWIGTVT